MADKNVKLKSGSDVLYPKTKISNILNDDGSKYGRKTLIKSITDIITDATKIQGLFTAMDSSPENRTHYGVALDNTIPFSEIEDCDKIILDLSSLSALGLDVGGSLIFTRGFNTNNFGKAFYLIYMKGASDGSAFTITTVVLSSGHNQELDKIVVEQSGRSV